MKISEYTQFALKGIVKKKRKSILSICSLTIGIATVIFINTCSTSGIAVISGEMSKLGVNCCVIDNNVSDSKTIYKLQQYLNEDCYVSTVLKTQCVLSSGSKDANVTVYGCDEELINILDYKVIYGRNLTIKDLINSEKVIIIDSSAAEKLFNFENVIGKKIIIDFNGFDSEYTIVGVCDSSALVKNGTANIPSTVFIPHTSTHMAGGNKEKMVYIYGKNKDNVENAVTETLKSINKANKYAPPLEAETTNIYKENILYIADTMKLILMLISFISVLSGCINMINLMLNDVNERRNEIAIKKALGQTNKETLLIFIVESITTMIVSAIFGIIIGNTVSFYILSTNGIEYISDAEFQIILIVLSVITGTVFGLFPLKSIFKMNPVDIL